MSQHLIFTRQPGMELLDFQKKAGNTSLFFITDSNTCSLVTLLIESAPELALFPVITIPAGDTAKNIQNLAFIWEQLQNLGATRHSIIVNLGGGMITDIGGFAAATFKRGVSFVNIPTTILGAVDAAVGGKTGINFNGIKNEIGTFKPADLVIISDIFYSTLSNDDRLSGYGEMIKHALLSSPETLQKTLELDILDPQLPDMLELVRASVAVKQKIVKADPFEKGIRKALNLGHTAGHAFESLAMHRAAPVPHGVAVAFGLVVDLVLSNLLLDCPSKWLYPVAQCVAEIFNGPVFTCDDYPQLIEFMRHDKKNITPDGIIFTLLREPGSIEINQTVSEKDIISALDITRDLLHL